MQISFLARPHIIRRMLNYVDGSAFDDEPQTLEASADSLSERERKKRKCVDPLLRFRLRAHVQWDAQISLPL